MAVKNNYSMITGFENLNLQGTIGTLSPSEGPQTLPEAARTL